MQRRRRSGRAPSPASFDGGIPRRWFAGLAVPTHIVNAVNLLFPAGERFFVRSVHHYLHRIDDDALRAQVKGFFGQEGRHAGAHERFFDAMEAEGLEIRGFLATYEKIAFEMLEPIAPPKLRLSITAALEHFTAIMAENALRDGVLQHAHPEMRRLLYWHACEEIEHKAVAFDVLQRVAPSYAMRVAGLAVATVALGAFWVAALTMLLQQEKRLGGTGSGAAYREWRSLPKERSIPRDVFAKGIRQYLRRDFHPSQNDNLALAQDWLAGEGIA